MHCQTLLPQILLPWFLMVSLHCQPLIFLTGHFVFHFFSLMGMVLRAERGGHIFHFVPGRATCFCEWIGHVFCLGPRCRFLVVLFSVLHRKALLQAVHAKITSPSCAPYLEAFRNFSHADFHHLHRVVGTAGSVADALRTYHLLCAVHVSFFCCFSVSHVCFLCFLAVHEGNPAVPESTSKQSFALCAWFLEQFPAQMALDNKCVMNCECCSYGLGYLLCFSL